MKGCLHSITSEGVEPAFISTKGGVDDKHPIHAREPVVTARCGVHHHVRDHRHIMVYSTDSVCPSCPSGTRADRVFSLFFHGRQMARIVGETSPQLGWGGVSSQALPLEKAQGFAFILLVTGLLACYFAFGFWLLASVNWSLTRVVRLIDSVRLRPGGMEWLSKCFHAT